MEDRHQHRARIHQWLFPPGSAAHLGLFRILCFAHLFILLQFGIFTGLQGLGEIPSVLYQPVSFLKWFGLPKPGPEATTILILGLKVSTVLSCVGLMTRTSITITVVISVYLFGVTQCFGKIYHGTGLMVFMFAILALSRAGSAFSLDALLKSKSAMGVKRRGFPAIEFGWPFRLCWIAHCMAMLGAGLSKVGSGLSGGWFGSEGMSSLLRYHHYALDPPLDWGLFLAQSDLICLFMALATVAAETLSPLALFFRRLRLPLIGALFLMQLGIALLLGVHTNLPWLMFYVAWLPWPLSRLWRKGAGERPKAG